MNEALKAYRRAMHALGIAYRCGTPAEIDRLETHAADCYATLMSLS